VAAPEEGTAAVSFVGRDRELARVVGLLDEARAGRGRLLLCTGEAGIGKTRLAGETAALVAAQGAAVAWARSSDRDIAPPYGLWRPAQAAERSGLLLVLDDIQWADEPSLLLAHLVRQLRGVRMLILATCREPTPPGDRSGELIRVLPADANTERAVLHELPPVAVAALPDRPARAGQPGRAAGRGGDRHQLLGRGRRADARGGGARPARSGRRVPGGELSGRR
jgi:hypothetical protein